MHSILGARLRALADTPPNPNDDTGGRSPNGDPAGLDDTDDDDDE